MATNTSVEITVDFKTSSRRKNISVNSIYSKRESDICSGLPLFHSFSEVTSTCSFFKQPKKDWFRKWLDFPMKEELDEKFRILSKCPKKDIVEDCHPLIQQFVVHVYLRKFDFICEFELKWFQNINTIQRCPIATFTVGILSIGMGIREFIVAGSSSSERVVRLEDSMGEFKIQLENNWLLWQN